MATINENIEQHKTILKNLAQIKDRTRMEYDAIEFALITIRNMEEHLKGSE